jgi:hypothetical protein
MREYGQRLGDEPQAARDVSLQESAVNLWTGDFALEPG